MMNYFAQLIDNTDPATGKHILPSPNANNDTLQNILNAGFAIIGAVALLMVVIAGFRYIRAGSNETIVAESRRQLAHAIVGLIVVASAALIVNFVLSKVG